MVRLTTIDMHTGGEPVRIVTSGYPDVPGPTILAKRRYVASNLDHLRRLLMYEPRGHADMYGVIPVTPDVPGADLAVLFMHNEGYSTMCGHGVIALTTALLETGMLPMREPVTELTLESPAGLIRVRADCAEGKVRRVTFRNVPAFAAYLDRTIEVPQLGSVTVDVAYGGMFYVIADAERFGLRLTPDEGRDIVRIGEMIKAAAREQLPVVHPEQPGFEGITIAQLSGPPSGPHADRRNAVIVSTGELDWNRPSTWTGAIDRSPCGTGTCAKMAVLHAKGQLGLQQDFRHEGILGTVFTGRLVEAARVGDCDAVVPTLSGQAWITGMASYVVDPSDPFPEGFTVGDIW